MALVTLRRVRGDPEVIASNGEASAAAVTSARCAACDRPTLVPHLALPPAGGPDGRDMSPTTDRYGTALADTVRCTSCGHVQLDPLPADGELVHEYEQTESYDYIAEEIGQRATARATLERIERHVGTGRLVDIGCWVGFLLAEARDRGWNGVGIEPSHFASSYARDRLGLDVRTGALFDAHLPEHVFDAVTMGDVIEHLARPGEALDHIASLLAPGGVVWLALPDAGSRIARVMGRRWWSVIPTHVQYFTRGSLRVLLERHGYTPLELTTAPKAFTVRYYLERIGGYSAPASAALVRAAGAAGVADRLWAPDFRDRMAIIARGPA